MSGAERTDRGQADAAGLDKKCRQPHWSPVERKCLSRVHDATYIEQVETFAARGGGHIEADTVVSEHSYAVALSAAGAVCDAVRRVLEGPEKSALCLVRPPGHHARKNAAMGFCLFNNIAVGACVAVDQFELDRVLVVDWDVHHGNGTQEAFWSVPEVAFYSIHRWPFYPGSGADDAMRRMTAPITARSSKPTSARTATPTRTAAYARDM